MIIDNDNNGHKGHGIEDDGGSKSSDDNPAEDGEDGTTRGIINFATPAQTFQRCGQTLPEPDNDINNAEDSADEPITPQSRKCKCKSDRTT